MSLWADGGPKSWDLVLLRQLDQVTLADPLNYQRIHGQLLLKQHTPKGEKAGPHLHPSPSPAKEAGSALATYQHLPDWPLPDLPLPRSVWDKIRTAIISRGFTQQQVMSLIFTAPSKARGYDPRLEVWESEVKDRAQGHRANEGHSWDANLGLSNPKAPRIHLPLAATEGDPGHSVRIKPVPQEMIFSPDSGVTVGRG